MKKQSLIFLTPFFISLLSFLLVSPLNTFAREWLTASIKSHVESSDCYEVQVDWWHESEDGVIWIIASTTAWIGSDCDRLGYGCSLVNLDCPAFQIDGRTFCASEKIPRRECPQTLFSEPSVWSAYLALEAELLQRIRGAGQPRGLVNHAKSGMIQLSPNPANGFTLIKVDGRQLTEDATLRIYDLTGKVQFTALCRAGLQPVISLMLSDFAAGRYEVVLDCKGVIKAKDVLIIR